MTPERPTFCPALTTIDGTPVYVEPALPYTSADDAGVREEVHCVRITEGDRERLHVSPQLAEALRERLKETDRWPPPNEPGC